MDEHEILRKLLPTPFFSSWVGQARHGDLFADDPKERASAWAAWAVDAIAEMRGFSDRAYYALLLPGAFYDPKGRGPTVRPHLEIPAYRLQRPDPFFPSRLAQMGNGLHFQWWVPSEVTAAKRALFGKGSGSPEHLIDLLNASRNQIRRTLTNLQQTAAKNWATVERLLVTSDDGLSTEATGDFNTDEIDEFFPAGKSAQLSIVFDPRLRERNGIWASRRVGVWQITGIDEHGAGFGLGVVTPRLTANSQFVDPLFSASHEAPAAMLVRGLLLQRLVREYMDVPKTPRVVELAPRPAEQPQMYLRAVVAQPGAKLPEASLAAAVRFLQTYPKALDAWEALDSWARRTGSLLTVTDDGFTAAHRRALRFLRRAEDPDRDDVNVLLPLAWDKQSRVVRVTFSRPPGGADGAPDAGETSGR